ncbi:hypothetical protein [Pseudohaliea sp.]|uniref:hypothetical protein n=1 Tax=Pseudohaliea sp. TaxID=2740289 RepID=UPI0032ECCC3C
MKRAMLATALAVIFITTRVSAGEKPSYAELVRVEKLIAMAAAEGELLHFAHAMDRCIVLNMQVENLAGANSDLKKRASAATNSAYVLARNAYMALPGQTNDDVAETMMKTHQYIAEILVEQVNYNYATTGKHFESTPEIMEDLQACTAAIDAMGQ